MRNRRVVEERHQRGNLRSNQNARGAVLVHLTISLDQFQLPGAPNIAHHLRPIVAPILLPPPQGLCIRVVLEWMTHTYPNESQQWGGMHIDVEAGG